MKDESLVNKLVPAHVKVSWLVAFAVLIEAEIGWEHNIFMKLWNYYTSDKVEILYLVTNPGSRPLFIRNSYVNKQETIFHFTFKLLQLVPKSTNLTNGEY